jgi:hypothetical protein
MRTISCPLKRSPPSFVRTASSSYICSPIINTRTSSMARRSLPVSPPTQMNLTCRQGR